MSDSSRSEDHLIETTLPLGPPTKRNLFIYKALRKSLHKVKGLSTVDKRTLLRYLVHQVQAEDTSLPRPLPPPLPYEDLYRFKPRSAQTPIIPASFRLLGRLASSTTLRLRIFHSIRSFLHRRMKAGVPLWSLVEDFKRFGRASLYASTHVTCLRHESKWLRYSWPIQVVKRGKTTTTVLYLAGLPKGLTAALPTSLVDFKGGVALAAPSFCLSVFDLDCAQVHGLKGFSSVPVLMAFKVQVSKDDVEAENFRQEATLSLLANAVVQTRICPNFNLVYEYQEVPCNILWNPDILPEAKEGIECETHRTHFMLNELADGNLEDWMREGRHAPHTNAEIGAAFFQCLVPLWVMHHLWGVSHNDTHFGNFLFVRLDKPRTLVYDFPVYGKRIVLSNQRCLFKIWDFGLASQATPETMFRDVKELIRMFSHYGPAEAYKTMGKSFILSPSYLQANAEVLPGVSLRPLNLSTKLPGHAIRSLIPQPGSRKANLMRKKAVRALTSKWKVPLDLSLGTLVQPVTRLEERFGSATLTAYLPSGAK